MPWCPICAIEYQESVSRCSDCGSALVPEPPFNAEDDDSPDPAEIMRTRDRNFLEHAVVYLAKQSVPAEITSVPGEYGLPSGYALLTDGRLWTAAVDFLLAVPAMKTPELVQPDLAAVLPATLNQPLAEIIDRGESSLVDLGKGLLAGDPETQTRCDYALVEIGEPAREFLAGMLLDAIRADDSWRIQRICRPLARFSDHATVDAVLNLLDSDDHNVSIITALGYLRDESAVPRLVQLLDHEDVSVRDEAAEALYNVTGRPFEFEADDPPETRLLAVQQWHRWMRWRGLA